MKDGLPKTWLEQYARLMGAIERFRAVFVATTDMNFQWPEYLVRRWLPSLHLQRKPVSAGSTELLMEYFRLDRNWQFGDCLLLDSDKIERLNHLQQEFDDAVFATYQLPWKYDIFRTQGGTRQ